MVSAARSNTALALCHTNNETYSHRHPKVHELFINFTDATKITTNQIDLFVKTFQYRDNFKKDGSLRTFQQLKTCKSLDQ